MKDELKNFICVELLSNHEVGDEENLLLSGLVDSIGVMRLLAYIKENFRVAVPPEDVTIQNFMSITTITRYLEGRRAG